MIGTVKTLAAGMAAVLLGQTQAAAQAETVQAIRDAMIIDVALVLGEVEPGSGQGTLWVRGDRPAETTLARFTVKPLQVAVTGAEDASASAPASGALLWRAFPGGLVSGMRAGQLDLVRAPRYFCRAGSVLVPPICLIDQDSDGRFDHQAEALAERGAQAYHLTAMKPSRPIPQPIAYHILPPDQRPAIAIELENCDRDHDRPRFSARSVADRAVPLQQATFAWMQKDSTLSACRRSRRLEAVPTGALPPPVGGFVAQLGPFAFTIGEKKNPVFALSGPVDPEALYRIESNGLVELSVGFTPDQARLVALKKFPYPMMLTDEGTMLAKGTVAKGAPIASIAFHHAYRGRLTQDVTIATLFGKRSVAAGTQVYGFPAKSSLSVTRNGIPDLPNLGDEDFRTVNLELTWCAPIRRDPAAKEKPDPVGLNGWSAACLPHSLMGNHTILTDRQPAFGITGLSYAAASSSNNGPPPIERDDERAFDKPLRLDYIYEGYEGEFISLARQVRYGEELTSTQPEKIYAPDRSVTVLAAGAPVALSVNEAGELTATPSGTPVIGADPTLTWDQQALFRKQIEKIGLRMVEDAPTSPN